MGLITAAAIIGAAATVGGTAYSIYEEKEARKDAKSEANEEKKKQDVLVAESKREQDKTKEIADAQKQRVDSKKRARKTRSMGGGGLLSGGDTGLMNSKQKLGE